MGTFSDYLSRKMEPTVTKEEHPSVLVAEAIEEARELGQSVAGMFGDHSRRKKLEGMNLKLRGS
jgi:alpha-D-ribose 1-methylphosphonate 5-triphosphate synthase subunit PhnL